MTYRLGDEEYECEPLWDGAHHGANDDVLTGMWDGGSAAGAMVAHHYAEPDVPDERRASCRASWQRRVERERAMRMDTEVGA